MEGQEVIVGSISIACLSCHDGAQAMDVVINAPGSGNYNPAGRRIDPSHIGAMTGSPVPVVGPDLTDDHPISIQYGGGGCSENNVACTPLRQPDFVVPAAGIINSRLVWWVDTGGAQSREKTDMILYSRNDLGQIEPFVECGSCHDPHDDTKQPVSFMRISNAGSRVCLACHIKG